MLIINGRIVWLSGWGISPVSISPSRLVRYVDGVALFGGDLRVSPLSAPPLRFVSFLGFDRNQLSSTIRKGEDILDVTMLPSVDDRFPVSFYFRIADQLLKQVRLPYPPLDFPFAYENSYLCLLGFRLMFIGKKGI